MYFQKMLWYMSHLANSLNMFGVFSVMALDYPVPFEVSPSHDVVGMKGFKVAFRAFCNFVVNRFLERANMTHTDRTSPSSLRLLLPFFYFLLP